MVAPESLGHDAWLALDHNETLHKLSLVVTGDSKEQREEHVNEIVEWCKGNEYSVHEVYRHIMANGYYEDRYKGDRI